MIDLAWFESEADRVLARAKMERWRIPDMSATEKQEEISRIDKQIAVAREFTNPLWSRWCSLKKSRAAISQDDWEMSVLCNGGRRLLQHLRDWRSLLLNPPRSNKWLYFAQAEDGTIKIGVSQNVDARLATLKKKHKTKLIKLGVRAGNVLIESSIHYNFAEERIKGEWFRPSPRLLEFIQQYAQPPEPIALPLALNIRPDRHGKRVGETNATEPPAPVSELVEGTATAPAPRIRPRQSLTPPDATPVDLARQAALEERRRALLAQATGGQS